MTGRPEYVKSAIADQTAAIIAAYAIMAALFERERTGRVQAVEVPMFESMIDYLMAEQMGSSAFVPAYGAERYPRMIPPAGFRDVVETNLTGYFLMAREITPRMLAAGHGRIVNVSVNSATMTRAGFVPYGPSRAGTEAMSRVMDADLRGTGVTVNLLLPGGATATGMIPAQSPAQSPPQNMTLLDPAVMGPPIVWLASTEAAGVHDERIVATEFEPWLRTRRP